MTHNLCVIAMTTVVANVEQLFLLVSWSLTISYKNKHHIHRIQFRITESLSFPMSVYFLPCYYIPSWSLPKATQAYNGSKSMVVEESNVVFQSSLVMICISYNTSGRVSNLCNLSPTKCVVRHIGCDIPSLI